MLFKNVSVKKEKDYLIVLPEGCDGKDMMVDTMGRSETYIEYFHYNGRSQIDGFITPHLKNMVTVNNDYDLRKNICNQRNKKYPVEAITFNNQGLTSIAVNLFKQIYGYIPKSDYNRYVTTIMDDYYPKALQHTFYTDPTHEFELTALDISKDYPVVLLTNKHNIPIYNIYNTIEKFYGKLKTGEYYINETYIKKYKTCENEPITIEAGFYGRNLMDYTQLVAQAKSWIQLGLQFYQEKFGGQFYGIVRTFKAARLSCPIKVQSLNPTAASLQELRNFPFITDDIIVDLAQELPGHSHM